MLIRLIVPGEYPRVEDLNASLATVLARHGIDSRLRHDVRLIVEELASNAIDHGAGDLSAAQHELSVNLDFDGDLVALEFRDTGAPFDPLAEPAPDLDAGIDERPLGGLGVYLIRQLAEDIRYRREDGANILSITLRSPSPEPTP
jgi:serine/threonine-protein kinase RsbW